MSVPILPKVEYLESIDQVETRTSLKGAHHDHDLHHHYAPEGRKKPDIIPFRQSRVRVLWNRVNAVNGGDPWRRHEIPNGEECRMIVSGAEVRGRDRGLGEPPKAKES